MSSTSSNPSRGLRFLSVVALLLLLTATTVQAAHFCGMGNFAAAVDSHPDAAGESAVAPCAICLASHQSSNVVAAVALHGVIDLGRFVAATPATTAAKGETLFVSVRPPPAC